jgi:hypothetical protein
MKRESAELFNEAGIMYYRPSEWQQVYDRLAKVFLYRCHGARGSVVIQHVYCFSYADFLKLLDRWNYLGEQNGWKYTELD